MLPAARAKLAQAEATLEKLAAGARPEELRQAEAVAEQARQRYQIAQQATRKQDIAAAAALEDAARAGYRPNPAAARRNVILIVVDALRPDHMGVNGYARDTTPNLSRLAKAGVVRNIGVAHASCSESSCGLLSLASSKYVHQFSSRPFTLQQVLVQHGYRIHLILGGDHTNFYGLKESYGKVDSYFDGSDEYGVAWDDPAIAMPWGAEAPILSPRDRGNPLLRDIPAGDLPL